MDNEIKKRIPPWSENVEKYVNIEQDMCYEKEIYV